MCVYVCAQDGLLGWAGTVSRTVNGKWKILLPDAVFSVQWHELKSYELLS